MNKQENTIDKSELLSKYRSGTITTGEIVELRKIIQDIPDTELYISIEADWNKFQTCDSLPNGKLHSMLTHIEEKMHTTKQPRQIRFRLRIAVAAAIIIACSLIPWLYMIDHTQRSASSTNSLQQISFKTGSSGMGTVQLPDGTIATLNTNSELIYNQDFGKTRRDIKLIGEGYFVVARDESKSFVVNTETMNIKVLGTTFNVNAYPQNEVTEMSLIEGSVEVIMDTTPYKSTKLSPNEKAVYNKRTCEFSVHPTQNLIETAWISKELIFSQHKLDEVFLCLERKFGVNIIVSNTNIQSETYTGTFDCETIDEILQILQSHFGFTISETDKTIYIK